MLALDAPVGLPLRAGDAVAVLADGSIIAADAIVTETPAGDTITIALPLASAGAVAAVNDIAVIARATD